MSKAQTMNPENPFVTFAKGDKVRVLRTAMRSFYFPGDTEPQSLAGLHGATLVLTNYAINQSGVVYHGVLMDKGETLAFAPNLVEGVDFSV